MLKEERKIKAVIFDMDGVLIDGKEWHYESLNKALGLFGYEISRYDHLVTYDGLPTSKKLEMLSMEKGMPRRLHSFVNELKQKYTLEKVYESCHPVFTHEYALSMLKREGYELAVASNSVKNTVDLMMEKSDLAKYLKFTLSNQDVKESKPNPEIYNVAIQRLHLTPEECLVVEDNINGINAARAAGAYVMEVDTVYDVNYANIKKHIEMAEKEVE